MKRLEEMAHEERKAVLALLERQQAYRRELAIWALIGIAALFLAIGSWHLWGWFIRLHVGDCS